MTVKNRVGVQLLTQKYRKRLHLEGSISAPAWQMKGSQPQEELNKEAEEMTATKALHREGVW